MKKLLHSRATKLFIVGAFAMATVCVAFHQYQLAQIDAAILNIQSDDEPVTLADVSHSVTNQKDDAVFYLSQAKPLMNALVHTKEFDLDSLQRPVDKDMIQQYEKVLHDYPRLFPLISKACEATDISVDVSISNWDEVSEDVDYVNLIDMQCFGLMLQWKAKLELSKGNANAAAGSARQIAQLGNHAGRRPKGILSLMAYAYQSKAALDVMTAVLNSSPDEHIKSKFFEAVEELDPRAVYVNSIQSERVWNIAMAQRAGHAFKILYGSKIIDKFTDEIHNYRENVEPLDDGLGKNSMKLTFETSREEIKSLIARIDEFKSQSAHQ